MTLEQAKEVVIDRMNAIAYQEYDFSLFPSDRDRLFGTQHYQLEPHTYLPDYPSRWAPGQDLEPKLPELLAYAWSRAESSLDQHFLEALYVVRLSDGFLSDLIAQSERTRAR